MGSPKSDNILIDERDDWARHGYDISSPESLAKIEATLEKEPIILEHWFYRGSSAPARLIFDEYADFSDYLRTRARPGDHILIWPFSGLCRDDNKLVSGKISDQQGRTPRGGAY